MTRRVASCLLVVWSATVGTMEAQHVLTLDRALAIAAERNPTIVRARQAERIAGVERIGAWGRLLPTIAVTGGFDVTRTRSFTATDEFGDPAQRDDAIEVTTRGSHQGVGIAWTLYDGADRPFGVAAANDRLEAARAAAEARWVEVRAEVTKRYAALLRARAMVGIEAAILAARTRDVEVTELLFRVVAADRIDVLGARIEAVRQEAVLAEAIERTQRSEIELARAIGVDGAIESELAPLGEPLDPAGLDPGALRRTAVRDHPDLRRLAAEVRAARTEARAAGWWARLPRIRADASFRRSEFGDRETPLFNLDPANSAWRFGLSFTLPVFEGFRGRVLRRRADLGRRDAEERLRERRLAIVAAVEGRRLDLASAHRRLAVEREAADMARERVALTRRKYRVGAVEFTRLQRVVDQANAAERRIVARRFEYHRALVELERALGRSVARRGGPAAGE